MVIIANVCGKKNSELVREIVATTMRYLKSLKVKERSECKNKLPALLGQSQASFVLICYSCEKVSKLFVCNNSFHILSQYLVIYECVPAGGIFHDNISQTMWMLCGHEFMNI